MTIKHELNVELGRNIDPEKYADSLLWLLHARGVKASTLRRGQFVSLKILSNIQCSQLESLMVEAMMISTKEA